MTSASHASVMKTKRRGRKMELVVLRDQLGAPLDRMTHYMQNANK